MWNQLMNSREYSKVNKNNTIEMIDQILDQTDPQCIYSDSWIQLWSDIKQILLSKVNINFSNILVYFIEWYDNNSMICDLKSLQNSQVLRFKILDTIIT